MKTVVQINVCCDGSTGRIMNSIHDIYNKSGNHMYCAYGRGRTLSNDDYIRIGGDIDIYGHVAITRLCDLHGFGSGSATKRLIQKFELLKPDLVHLHNIHGYYLNIELLFGYLKKNNIPVVWTLHDCWAFTGHCAYFDFVGCEKWKTGCFNCPQKKEYPSSLLADNSKWNFKRKKQRFTSLGNLTIVTPSKWLSELVKQSFLKNYPVKVINNGIDLERFKPTQGNFREKYNLKDKFILLGVANVWEPRKGLKYMLELANRLDDSYQVIVLGVTEKQRQSLPENVLGILKTHNLQELAEIYTAADVYVNPTLEDNFPTTNLEALACGTPVVTFNTGGSTESIDDTCGIAVEKGRADALEDAIMHVRSGESTLDACVKRAGMFDQTNAYLEYLRLYEKLLR